VTAAGRPRPPTTSAPGEAFQHMLKRLRDRDPIGA
jgi:hypothetical protein